MSALEIVFLSIFLVFSLTALYLLFSSEMKYILTLKRNNALEKLIYKYTVKKGNKYQVDLSWWDNFNVMDIEIISYDKLKLHGYFISQNDKKIAVVVHGYGSDAKAMQPYAKMFYDKGYSVLCVDQRAHGKSQGKCTTMGYSEHIDLSYWITYLVEKYKDCQIVVFGLSMGGATVCLYSGDKKPKNVKAIISDCAYSRAYDVLGNICEQSIVLNFFPSLFVFNHYLKFRAKFDLSSIDVKSAIKNSDIPILLIHGNQDKFVPFYMQDILYNNAPKNLCEKYVVKGAGHAESLAKAKDDYIKTVDQFLNSKIK